VNFDGLTSTFGVTMPHFMLLNNWHVTYNAMVKAFGLSISNGKSNLFFNIEVNASTASMVAKLVVRNRENMPLYEPCYSYCMCCLTSFLHFHFQVLVWTMSYFVVMVIVILNILISWFFEIYSKHFNQEHELIQYRQSLMESHKNDLYVGTQKDSEGNSDVHHELHNIEVER